MLAASDEEELRSALEAAALLRAKEVLPLVEERVRSGLTPVLLEVALDTLVLLADAGATPLLNDLAHHRRPSVRVRVLDLFAQLDPKRAEPVALAALGDLEPEVRSAAAEVLGRIGAKGAFERLQRAFELGVEGAARALGQVAKANEVPTLAALYARHSFESTGPLSEALLARRDLASADKQRIVDAIAAVPTDEARAELTRLLALLPRDAPADLRRKLTQAAQAGAKP